VVVNTTGPDPAQVTRLVVELHPGADLCAYVEGEAGQTPMLCVETDVVAVMVSPDSQTVTPADVAAANLVVEAATRYRDQLRGMVAE